ncbi:MAG: fumarylacetoacetate hydrolase family protein, partial [Planctomycetota bacterium]
MKFCSFQAGPRVGAGILKGKDVIDLGIAYFKNFKRPWKFSDLGDFLAQGALARFEELKWDKIGDDPKMRVDVDFVTFRAPIVRPPKVICVGRNYPEHAKEQNAEVPTSPMLFAKAPNVAIGNGKAIEIPTASTQVDHEVELGVVIKDACDRVPKAEAMDHVLGFTIVNDVSARDIQYGDKQWFRGKSFRTF